MKFIFSAVSGQIIRMNYNVYVSCFFPGCPNTSITAPGKIFFDVPAGERRKVWWEAAGRKDAVSAKSRFKCCQDHFKLEEDVILWPVYITLEESAKKKFRMKLKPNVVPRRYEYPSIELISVIAEDALVEELPDLREPHDPEQHIKNLLEESLRSQVQVLTFKDVVVGEPSSSQMQLAPMLKKPQLTISNVRTVSCLPKWNLQMSDITTVSFCPPRNLTMSKMTTISYRPPMSAGPDFTETSKVCEVPSSMVHKSAILTGKRKRVEAKDHIYIYNFSQNSDSSSATGASQNLSQGSTAQDFETAFLREQAQKINMKIMTSNPRLYLGLSPNTMGLLDILGKFTNLSRVNLFIVFRKIRLNESMEILADVFGIDKSLISTTLRDSIPRIAAYLKKFIFWPDRKIIQANIPIAFRAHYGTVEAILDCFEVQIEKPTNAVFQALTWSNYKNCNTVKFLVSCTPDGFINYVSHGFGGRASDTQIVQNCGFLDVIKPNTLMMADRGFKHIETSLLEKECNLVRPPSVGTDAVMTRDEVRETKIIASLRINVERIIKRIREFSFVKPHSCFHHALTDLIDGIVIIVCALSNLQSPIVFED